MQLGQRESQSDDTANLNAASDYTVKAASDDTAKAARHLYPSQQHTYKSDDNQQTKLEKL